MTQRELHRQARAWAKANNIPIGTRGRVPTIIVEAYRNRPGNEDQASVDQPAVPASSTSG